MYMHSVSNMHTHWYILQLVMTLHTAKCMYFHIAHGYRADMELFGTEKKKKFIYDVWFISVAWIALFTLSSLFSYLRFVA